MPPAASRPARRILIEVCVESVGDAVAAVAAGAERIELNSALALDGLTATPGLLVEARRAVRAPLVAMARPRAGDFCYSDVDFRVLRRDVEYALEHGADGVAFGVLNEAGAIDVRRCRTVARRVLDAKRDAVFHRAFDAVKDMPQGLEQLIDLGVRRVMTSGGRRTARAGAAVIARLREQAAGRIEILPAGGIRPDNLLRLLAATGCDQVHSSLRDRGGRMSALMLRKMLERAGQTP
jgi:copper homeostasis protein